MVGIKGGVGKMIRVLQWANGSGFSKYQHAFPYAGNGQIVEAEPGGAILTKLDERYVPSQVVWLKCPPEFGQAVAAAARLLGPHMDDNGVMVPGVPYSFLDYEALALRRLHIPYPHLKHYIESTKHEMCSQLSDHAAMLGGWRIFDDGRWPGDVVPNDLWRKYVEQEAAA
jgi:hypothetical protein